MYAVYKHSTKTKYDTHATTLEF